MCIAHFGQTNSDCGLGLADFCVADDDGFSHDGGDGDELLFSVGDEAFVEGRQRFVVSDCGKDGHEHVAFDLRSTASSPR